VRPAHFTRDAPLVGAVALALDVAEPGSWPARAARADVKAAAHGQRKASRAAPRCRPYRLACQWQWNGGNAWEPRGAVEVDAMSLSAWEQQALRSIEDGLMASDPKLTSLLATFTRLTSGEAMPVRKTTGARWRQSVRRSRGDRPRLHPVNIGLRARRLGQRLGWPRVVLLLGLAAVIAVTATMLIAGSGRRPACGGSWAMVCVQRAPAHSSLPAAHQKVQPEGAALRCQYAHIPQRPESLAR
jgi:hypothetical protein